MADVPDWGDSPDITKQTVSYFLRGIRTLWQLVSAEKRRILIATGVLALIELMNLVIPLIFKNLVDYLPTVLEEGITQYAFWLIVLMFITRVAMLALRRFVQEPIFLRAIINLENSWPQIAHQKLLALSVNYHERENTGKKIAKVNKGVEKLVSMLADFFWSMLPAAFYLFLNIPILIFLDWKLGFLFLVPLIPFVWINLRAYKTFYPQWEQFEKLKEKSVGLFCQSIINIRTVQAFVCEGREAEHHGSVREDMQELDLDICIRLQRYFFVMELILGVCFLGTIVTGLYFVSQGISTVGTVTYVFITGNVALQNLWGMIHVYTRMLRNLVAAERMQALLLEPIDVANESEGVVPTETHGVLSFEDVSHVYPGKMNPVVTVPHFVALPNEMVAFVGRTGSGKSTLVSLLTRTQDPTSGSVCLDGCNIRSLDRNWYRKLFAVVPQDVEILEGTIRDNIRLAEPNASHSWVDEAVEAACLSEFVTDTSRFPDGLLTKVGERGVRLSGGEKQRVGIARAYVALLAGARFLVLDEATSALDTQTERIVQEFIGRLRESQNITIVVIAHRLSTIYTADRICVLKEGRIVEEGSHDKLLSRNGLYARLVELQDMHEVRD